jgi:sporulation protein YlmC with PRC-barrel domain
MKKLVSGLTIGLFTLAFAAVPLTQAQRAINVNPRVANNTNQNAIGQVLAARQFVGQDLKTQKGEKLGKVEDFVVDLESGRILYGVVNAAGSSRAVPATMLRTGSDKKSLLTQATKQQVNGAPAVPKGNAPQLSSSSFASGVYQHYSQPMWWQGDASGGNAGKDFGNVHRATQLMNLSVQSSSNEKVGKIQNVLLDVNSGHVAFLILNPSDLLGAGNHVVAVPPNAFTKGTGNMLVTGLDKETLNGAPKFNNNYAELSQPDKASAIYSHYGKQPWFNTGLSPTGRE